MRTTATVLASFLALLFWLQSAWLRAQPAGAVAPNRVLELNGNGSYVELPEGIFDGLEKITVEGWVKWGSFRHYSRFFDFVVRGELLNVQNPERSSFLWLEWSPKDKGRDVIMVPDTLRSNEWFHIAAVSGEDGKKLFVNGAFASKISTHFGNGIANFTGQNFLGMSKWKVSGAAPENEEFQGQMDEVRVWKKVRTEHEIRDNMFKKLVGNELGLIGLWNFDDGTARDSSPSSHDGKLVGRARVLEAGLPMSVERRTWARFKVNATDSSGVDLEGATIGAEYHGEPVPSSFSVMHGVSLLTIWTNVPAVDLVLSAPGGIGDWRLEVPLSPGAESQLDWVLKLPLNIAGKVNALDGKTPVNDVVVTGISSARLAPVLRI